MRIIKLTSAKGTIKELYINIDQIGDICRIFDNGKEYTIVGCTTHNNGGFYVVQTPEQIIELIKNVKPI